MNTNQPLYVTHCVSYIDEPLACFANLPAFDAEMSPVQIRALAATLLLVAADCETLRDEIRRYGPEPREYRATAGLVVGERAAH
jgi:hypothetical protein